MTPPSRQIFKYHSENQICRMAYTRNAINNSINSTDFNLSVSSSRTCEIALSNNLNINFISIEALVYRALKIEK